MRHHATNKKYPPLSNPAIRKQKECHSQNNAIQQCNAKPLNIMLVLVNRSIELLPRLHFVLRVLRGLSLLEYLHRFRQ